MPLGASARKNWLCRVVGKVICGCACVLLLGIAQVQAQAIVTDNVVSLSRKTQANIPVTFGQIFRSGDVRRGETLTAMFRGKRVALQVDVKATNPDGSLRHAVLTALIPSLAEGVTEPLIISTSAPSNQGAAVTLSEVLATRYDATVSLNIAGTVYTADARALLQAADGMNACRPWGEQCNIWLAGPLVSEWVVHGPVTTASGSTNRNLQVYFAVRAYAGASPGTVGYVHTDIIVENSWAYAPQVQPQYTATLTSGAASYTSPALTEYAYTRWHEILWWNDAQPRVYLQANTEYIQNSKAISRYMALKPSESFLAGLRQSCAPLDHCDQTEVMHMAGAQPAIGPLPRWTSVYIIDPDVRAYNWMLANTDALGAYSIHYRDRQTGWPLSIRRHPYVTIVGWGSANVASRSNSPEGAKYKADLLPNCVNNSLVKDCDHPWYDTGNPNVWDNAHQPAESYVPYMVTGSYYYMSELAFGASHNEIWSGEAYRGFSEGLIDAAHSQVRAKAWTLREMADAAYLLPDSYPLKAEFEADVANSLEDWNKKYTNNPKANTLGVMNDGPVYSLNGGTSNGIAPWQHNFLTWSAGHAADLGFVGAAAFRNWLARFEIGLMTDWRKNPTHGYCWLMASAYNVQVKDSVGNWLPSYTAVYDATFPTLVGLACNSPTMVSAVGKLEKQAWQAGEMYGYPYAATGYPANFQTGLAAAVDSGLPDAKAAWELFQSRSVQPSGSTSYNDYPNFAILPRSLAKDP